jgi:hypothetical protein
MMKWNDAQLQTWNFRTLAENITAACVAESSQIELAASAR